MDGMRVSTIAGFRGASKSIYLLYEGLNGVNLGVWFDSNLSMGDHITKTSSAAFY